MHVEQVEVVIQVPRDTPIKQDAEASLEVQGITGAAYVLISGGTQAAAILTVESTRHKNRAAIRVKL